MPALPPFQALLHHLGTGETGVLHVEHPEGGVQVYVAEGELVAATSSADGTAVLRRLANGGVVGLDALPDLEAAVASGAALGPLLVGTVPARLRVGVRISVTRAGVTRQSRAILSISASGGRRSTSSTRHAASALSR